MTKGSALLAGTAAALLGLSACGQHDTQTAEANAAGNAADNATALNEPTASDTGAETTGGASGTNAAAEITSGSSAAPVAVVAPPAPAPNVAAAAAAPLAEAATITQTIAQGTDVERISYQGGWAWRQNGRIVRTASADGRRVSYFRDGDATPFLVQQDRQAVAFSHGKVERAYTPQGRPQSPDPSTQRAGEQLARQAVQDRSHAADVAKSEPTKVQKERPSRGKPAPATQPDASKPINDKSPANKSSDKSPSTNGSRRAQHSGDASKQSTDDKTGKRDRSDPRNEAAAAH